MNEVPATPFTHRLVQGRRIHEEIFARLRMAPSQSGLGKGAYSKG